jgi:hypothetical protein
LFAAHLVPSAPVSTLCLVGGMVAEGCAHRHREVFDVCLPVGTQLKELHSVPLLAVCQKGSGGDLAKLERGERDEGEGLGCRMTWIRRS